jgi:AcrR family transcriptional regulator
VFRTFRKVAKRVRKHRRHLSSAHRRSNLLRVGRHLLAEADYDRVSVAKIAGNAGCSVGAFYGRFPSKYTYLINLITGTFDAASTAAAQELDPRRCWDASNAEVVQQIIHHAVTTMRGETAGVARAAYRRASDATLFEPMLSYRNVVTKRAILLLEPRLPKSAKPRETVRAVMQIVHAAIADSLLQDKGPLHSGSRIMMNELSELVRRRLGIHKAADRSLDTVEV